MSNVRITVRVDHSLQKRLEVLARAIGKTESQLVRDALADYLPRVAAAATCLEVFKEAGVIGCVKQGPRDVSTNPKHMAGFGRE